jgi:predicted PurR-regulated permease PerM
MSSKDVTRIALRVILVVLLVVGALELLWLVRKPLSWLILALFLAVAMSRPVDRLSRHMARGRAITMSYLLLFLVPALILALIIPTIVNGANELAREAPGYVTDLQNSVEKNKKLRKLDRQYGITEKLQTEAAKLPTKAGDAANVLKDIGFGVINSIFAAVTIMVLSMFMVSSGRGWVLAALRSVPDDDRRTRVQRALETSANAVGNYVGGVIVQMTIAGITTFIVLTILGVPFAAPLAVVMALFDAIPLVGATIASVLILVITLFVDFPGATIAWAVWAVAYQQIENYLIQPRIQSKAVDVHPFVVLVSVLFGSTLFGIAGALLAIPVAASLQIGIREYLVYRQGQRVAAVVDPEPPAGADAGPGPGDSVILPPGSSATV